jgi:hypothetical protein
MENNTASEVSGQVDIADVLKILDERIKETRIDDRQYANEENYEAASAEQNSRASLSQLREAILELERKQ